MCGSKEGLMIVLGRRYNIDDIIVIVLVVELMKFIYRGRFVINYYIYMNLYLKNYCMIK